MKTSMTPNFPFADNLKRQTIGIGRMKIRKSEMRFMDPYANPAWGKAMQ